jgi:hypothetical protein
MKNLGNVELSGATEACFSSLSAPDFRDHEGSRTLVMTDHGFQPMTKIQRHVNPRLLLQDLSETGDLSSTGLPATGPLIALVSRDHRWVVSPVSLSGPPIKLFNNCEYSCLHANPPSDVRAGEERESRQRIYFLRGSLSDLMERYKADSKQNLSSGDSPRDAAR